MDIICMGEALIDFTPGKEERSYVCNPGGAPANACIAIARNGLKKVLRIFVRRKKSKSCTMILESF